MHPVSANGHVLQDLGFDSQNFFPPLPDALNGDVFFGEFDKVTIMAGFRNHQFPVKFP